MAVAVIRIWIPLDQSIWWNGHGPRVRLSFVGDNLDCNLWLGRGVHDLIRNANRTPVVESCTKIRMQRRARSDKGDDIIRVWIDRHRRDVCVPGVIARKRDEPIQVRARTDIHTAACAALRKTLARQCEQAETD